MSPIKKINILIKQWIADLRKDSRPLYKSGGLSGSQYQDSSTLSIEMPRDMSNYIATTFSSSGLHQGEWQNTVEPVAANKAADTREEKKPVEVFKEIFCEQPTMNLKDLDKQIALVKKRVQVLKDHVDPNMSMQDEITALSYLQARKKFKELGNQFAWNITTDAQIKVLLSKYKLQMVSFQGYYKNVPHEAIMEIEKFSLVWGKIFQGKPKLHLITDKGGPETKKDPILLAESPFGKWYYILGAWDREVEVVDELVYNGH